MCKIPTKVHLNLFPTSSPNETRSPNPVDQRLTISSPLTHSTQLINQLNQHINSIHSPIQLAPQQTSIPNNISSACNSMNNVVSTSDNHSINNLNRQNTISTELHADFSDNSHHQLSPSENCVRNSGHPSFDLPTLNQDLLG